MKLFDSVGKEHEEFKLRLEKDKQIEIAAIEAQIPIAEAQSKIVGEAMKSARIDIVGGESEFFERVVNSVKGGKVVDRFFDNSQVLSDVMAGSNRLGLFSEHFIPSTQTQCGNFPQAYSHVGLINAAFAASPSWNEVL